MFCKMLSNVTGFKNEIAVTENSKILMIMCAVVFIFFQKKMWKQQKSAWNIGCVLIKVIMSIKQATTTKTLLFHLYQVLIHSVLLMPCLEYSLNYRLQRN